MARPLRQGQAQRHREEAARPLLRPRRPHVALAPSWRAAARRPDDAAPVAARRAARRRCRPTTGRLATAVPTGRAAYQDSYVYDPARGHRPCPPGKDGPDGFLPYIAAGPAPRRAARPDLHDARAQGAAARSRARPSCGFWAVTEASDMAWVARLIDVAPDGSTSLITQGWLRAQLPPRRPGAVAPGRAVPHRRPRHPGHHRRDDRVPHGHLGHRLHGGSPGTGCGCGSARRHADARAAARRRAAT